jgi:hypothetical protein
MGESYEGHAKVKMSSRAPMEEQEQEQGKEERSVLVERVVVVVVVVVVRHRMAFDLDGRGPNAGRITSWGGNY